MPAVVGVGTRVVINVSRVSRIYIVHITRYHTSLVSYTYVTYWYLVYHYVLDSRSNEELLILRVLRFFFFFF